MIYVKNLSLDQLVTLYHMSEFNCACIECEDCPLFSIKYGCGSQRAANIIDRYEKETKQ